MGCSTECCSIEEKGCCVRGEVATGGRALPERSTGVGAAGLIIDPNREQSCEFSGCGGWVKEKGYDIANDLGDHGRTGGGTEERKKIVSTCCGAAFVRLPKDSALCLRSYLTSA